MTYLTAAELADRIDQEELDAVTSGLDPAQATAKIEAVLIDAESLVNGYLSRRYKIPVGDVRGVKPMVTSIARFLLWDNSASLEVRTRYEDTISLLRDIATSKADLAGATGDSEPDVASEGQRVLIGQSTAVDLQLEKY